MGIQRLGRRNSGYERVDDADDLEIFSNFGHRSVETADMHNQSPITCTPRLMSMLPEVFPTQRESQKEKTHIVFLAQIDAPAVFPDTQLFVLGQLAHFPVMSLVAESGGGGQEEGAEEHGGEERQAEEGEGMTGEEGAVAGGQRGGVVVAAPEGFGGEGVEEVYPLALVDIHPASLGPAWFSWYRIAFASTDAHKWICTIRLSGVFIGDTYGVCLRLYRPESNRGRSLDGERVA
nr:hypothetical protein CFP56_62904 [Quercus suber]